MSWAWPIPSAGSPIFWPCWGSLRSCSVCQRYCLESRKSIGPRCFYLRSRHSWPCWLSWACPVVREFDADRLAAELTGDPHGLASALAKIERVSRSSARLGCCPDGAIRNPPRLRTHPATAERIERLLELAPPPAMPPFPSARFDPEVTVSPRPPRWRTGGLWR